MAKVDVVQFKNELMVIVRLTKTEIIDLFINLPDFKWDNTAVGYLDMHQLVKLLNQHYFQELNIDCQNQTIICLIALPKEPVRFLIYGSVEEKYSDNYAEVRKHLEKNEHTVMPQMDAIIQLVIQKTSRR